MVKNKLFPSLLLFLLSKLIVYINCIILTLIRILYLCVLFKGSPLKKIIHEVPPTFFISFPLKNSLGKKHILYKKKQFSLSFFVKVCVFRKKNPNYYISTIKCYNILSKCMRVLLSESYNLGCFIQIPLTKKFTCTTPYDFVSCFHDILCRRKRLFFVIKNSIYSFVLYLKMHTPKNSAKPLQV